MQLRPDTIALTAVLALLTSLGPLSTDMYLPSLPEIGRVFAVDTVAVQLTLSLFLAGFAAGQVLYGPVADRYGRKPVLLAGLCLYIVASLVCALAPSVETLIAARFFQAFGASGPIVLARTIVRDLYEGPRAGRELSRMGTVMGLVPALAPILGGVSETVYGWRASFFASGAAGLLLGIVVLLGLPETLRSRSPAMLSPLGILRGYRVLLGNGTYRLFMSLSALAYAGLFCFISGSSFVLQRAYGLSELMFGFAFSFVVLGYVSGTVLAQRIVGRRGILGTVRVGVACLALGGVFMLIGGIAGPHSPFEILVPMAVYTCGVGLTMPQSMAGAMGPFPDRAGAASSFLGLVQMSAAAVVGIGLGHALEVTPLALPASVAVLGLGAFLTFSLAVRSGRGI
jgi:DHA1 family bicyclomycin/chloramphenicol resistance-like MFS transporter